MIFSGFFEERPCASCGNRRSRVTSTSIMLCVLLAIGGLAVVAWLSPGEGIATGSLWTLLPFFWTPPRNAPALSPEDW